MPIIGVVPNIQDDTYKVNEKYIEAINETPENFINLEPHENPNTKITPIIIPYTENPKKIKEYMSLVNGILLTGGGDISENHLTEKLSDKANSLNPKRDEFEIQICKYAIKHNLPLLGICRGMQILNLSSKGTINQHIENHDQTKEGKPRNEKTHKVHLHKKSKLYEIYKTTELEVNSIHHQCVDKIGENFKVSTIASDGTIEAIEHKINNFCIGVQWHPELLNDTILFSEFINSVTKQNFK